MKILSNVSSVRSKFLSSSCFVILIGANFHVKLQYHLMFSSKLCFRNSSPTLLQIASIVWSCWIQPIISAISWFVCHDLVEISQKKLGFALCSRSSNQCVYDVCLPRYSEHGRTTEHLFFLSSKKFARIKRYKPLALSFKSWIMFVSHSNPFHFCIFCRLHFHFVSFFLSCCSSCLLNVRHFG